MSQHIDMLSDPTGTAGTDAPPQRRHGARCAATVRIGLAALLAWAAAGPAQAGERIAYELDPVHTRVLFAIDHAGFSKALGTVSGSTGRLWFDEEDWSSAAVEAVIPIARLDLGDAAWNKATLANNLLDGEDFPEARFVSTRIEPLGDGRARIHGLLTLRGVTREVVLDAVLNAAKRHPLPPFRRTLGFSATAALSRKDFGIDAWPSVIGDAVELRIEVEAVRSRGQGHEGPDRPAPTTPTDAVAPDAVPAPTSEQVPMP